MEISKRGFTLSEVLITLTIIGVVASMTLSVMSKMYQTMVVKNQIKQVYSLISNAVNAVVSDDNLPHECYYSKTSAMSNECSIFFEAVVSKLKTVKYCSSYSFENGCLPDYTADNFPISDSCNGFSASNIKSRSPSAILKNGSIIFMYPRGINLGMPIIAFDINGFKGPNKPGQDVYAIAIYTNQSNMPVYGGYHSGQNSTVPLLHCMTSNKAYFRRLDEIFK